VRAPQSAACQHNELTLRLHLRIEITEMRTESSELTVMGAIVETHLPFSPVARTTEFHPVSGLRKKSVRIAEMSFYA